MVIINVYFNQLGDEDMVLTDNEPKYYCHDLLKPLKMSPPHVVFILRGIFAKQGKFFKPCT
jgi:hypothetical protein